jgi:hypothetical protein
MRAFNVGVLQNVIVVERIYHICKSDIPFFKVQDNSLQNLKSNGYGFIARLFFVGVDIFQDTGEESPPFFDFGF